MKKIISALIYILIIVASYGCLKIIMSSNAPEAGLSFPSAESAPTEGSYLVADRGPRWPLDGPKFEMPFPLSHSAPFSLYPAGEDYGCNLSSEVIDPVGQDINIQAKPIRTVIDWQKFPAFFQKNGGNLTILKRHYILLASKGQLPTLFEFPGLANHVDQSLYPQKVGQRIIAMEGGDY